MPQDGAAASRPVPNSHRRLTRMTHGQSHAPEEPTRTAQESSTDASTSNSRTAKIALPTDRHGRHAGPPALACAAVHCACDEGQRASERAWRDEQLEDTEALGWEDNVGG